MSSFLRLRLVNSKGLRFSLPSVSLRKDKLDVLGARRVSLAKPADDASERGTSEPDGSAGAGELESVFSCSMLPQEYYMEMLHSLAAIGVVDASPAQGPNNVKMTLHQCQLTFLN